MRKDDLHDVTMHESNGVNMMYCRERIGEARDELMRMLAEDELREAVLLIFANKQDLPNAMNAAEITDKLGLHSLRNRNWYIQVRQRSDPFWRNNDSV